MEFTLVTPGSRLWDAVKDYAAHCSWSAGRVLAKNMEGSPFAHWEGVVAAHEGGAVLGFCTVTKTDCLPAVPYCPYIGFLFVGEPHRGHRLSEKLIDFACGYLKKVGFSRVYLVSDHENLYEKYGFTVIDTALSPWGSWEKIYQKPL